MERTSREAPFDAGYNKLLMLAYYFPPMNESGAQRPFRFTKYLCAYGVETRVVTASDRGQGAVMRNGETSGMGSEMYRQGWPNYLARAVQRVLPYNDQLKWVPHAFAASSRVLNEITLSSVFSTSPPVATHITALLLKRRYGMRWVADLRDPIWCNPFRPGRMAGFWDRFVEQLIMKHADAVIGNTLVSVEDLKKRNPRHAFKVQLIWNGYDPEEDLRARALEHRECKYITHAGSIYGGRHPGELVASLSRLVAIGKIDPSRIKLRLIGHLDIEEPWVKQYNFKAFLQEPWMDCINRVLPRAEATKAMAESDYLLLLDLNDHGARLQVPAKLFEYIRIGRPILAFTSPESPAEYILKRSGVPFVCIYRCMRSGDKDGRLLSFLELPSGPAAPSEWFTRKFNVVSQTQALASILGF